jgi:tetratricopeptide (TPR) repeat protein
MSSLSLVLSRAVAARIAGDYRGAAELIDAYILASPGRDREDDSPLRIERAHIALVCGALHEARLILREIETPDGAVPPAWCSIAGALATLRGDHPNAERLLWRAVVAARAADDRHLEVRSWLNLAVCGVDLGRLVEAEGAIGCAEALGPDAEQRAVAYALRGAIAVGEGRFVDAEALACRAVEQGEAAGLSWIVGETLSGRAALRAVVGRLPEARTDRDRARELLRENPSPWARATAEVWAGFVDVAERDVARARARLDAAGEPLADGMRLVDADVIGRLAIRQLSLVLQQALPEAPQVGPPAVRVGSGGSSLAIGRGAPRAVESRSARSILLALARAAIECPGRPVSTAALIEAGWPGERIVRDAALNRLYVVLHRLRRVGLAAVLVTRRDGYHLDASAVSIAEASEERL